ncbi:MAG: PKD domain-containing protein [Flavobacteriales bacterium]|nr:PKD domain-containing protein [Flavobacteriales bacterium]
MKAKYTFLLLACTLSLSSYVFRHDGDNSGVAPHSPPNPAFSVSGLCFGDTTHFENYTILGFNYMWTVTNINGDTIFTSDSISPSYYFDTPGTYTVELMADNGHVVAITSDLTIGDSLYADFAIQTCTSNGMRFTTRSGCADHYQWIFPDGSTSDLPAPEYKFDSLGTYAVQLIAYNGSASDTLTRSILVEDLGIPTGEFTYTQSKRTGYFTPLDKDGQHYYWEFGDGTSIDTTAPVTITHTYLEDDDIFTYPVSLLVSNKCGLASKQKMFDETQTTSIGEVSSEITLCVFPNPSEGMFTINGWKENQSFHIRIFDLEGRMVFENARQSSTNIDLKHSIAPGIYYLQMTSDTRQAHARILIR